MKYFGKFNNELYYATVVQNKQIHKPITAISSIDSTNNKKQLSFRVLTVRDCIDEGFFTIDGSTVKPIAQLPYKIKQIYDFRNVFYKDRDIDNKKTGNYYTFIPGNEGHLTKSQLLEVVDTINNTNIVHRNLWNINFANMDLPESDIVINRYGEDGDEDYYATAFDYAHDFMSNSIFNTVTIVNKRGNISSMNSMFRRANMKNVEFVLDGGVFEPTDMAGTFEFCNMLTTLPNTISYRNAINIGWVTECCYSLTEIPSYYTVTDENSRLTTQQNIVGYANGITVADQAFNQCNNLKKIGPVLNCKRLHTTNGVQPYLMFNGCVKLEDVRISNLANSDWSFTNLYSMNIDSIKYCIDNLSNQYDCNWSNDIPGDNMGMYTRIDTKLSFSYPIYNKPVNTTKVKLKVPAEYSMDVYVYNSDKEKIDTVSITCDGTEREYTLTAEGAYYLQFILMKADGTKILPEDTKNSDISICLYVDGAYTNNIVVDKNHTVTFNGHYAEQISDKSIITAEDIETANNKGWKIFCETFEITPTSQKIRANYRFNFNDWELNTAYNNDVVVSDASIIINKFRPNMWIIRSTEAQNSTDLSGEFANIYMNISGISSHSNIFSKRFTSNGAVGGDGGTTGTICGVGILPYSLHSTPTTYYAPELPFSAYVWDSATKNDGTTVQVGSELTAWRGDWGAGYNGYGFIYDKVRRCVYPDISTFPTPYNNYNLAIGLYTGNVLTFDRWWADNATLKGYLTFDGPFKASICGRRTDTSTSKMLGTQERFSNIQFKISNMLEGDSIKWSHTNSTIVDENGTTITEITQDGIYTISNNGVDGGFILLGDGANTGTHPVEIEILTKPDYIDEEGYIDISANPIIIELCYDNIEYVE